MGAWWRGWPGGLLLIGIYLATYSVVRAEHLIVHATGLVGLNDKEGPVIASHHVRAGDPGIPFLNPEWTLMVLSSSHFFKPLMLLETVMWYGLQPRGSPSGSSVAMP